MALYSFEIHRARTRIRNFLQTKTKNNSTELPYLCFCDNLRLVWTTPQSEKIRLENNEIKTLIFNVNKVHFRDRVFFVRKFLQNIRVPGPAKMCYAFEPERRQFKFWPYRRDSQRHNKNSLRKCVLFCKTDAIFVIRTATRFYKWAGLNNSGCVLFLEKQNMCAAFGPAGLGAFWQADATYFSAAVPNNGPF